MKLRTSFLMLLTVIMFSKAQGQLFHENFENPDSVTYSSTGTGSWATNTCLHASGLSCDSATILNPGDVLKMTTIPFDATASGNVFLYFNHICKIEFFDNAEIEVSIDGGASWMKLIDDMSSSTNCQYLGSGLFVPQDSRFQEASYAGWDAGNSSLPDNGWWKTEIFDLSALCAYQPDVRLRFVMTDGNNTGGAGRTGWYIDDILVSDSLNVNIFPLSNLITGKLFVDFNSNQVMDGPDVPVINQGLWTGMYGIGTNDSTGTYNLIVPATGTVYIYPYNSGSQSLYYNVSPNLDSAIFTGYQQIDSLHDFAYQPTGTFNDLGVTLPYSGHRVQPGINTIIPLWYKNQGTTTLNPTIILHPAPGFSYLNTIGLQPTSVTTDSIVWDLTNVTPLSQDVIFLNFAVDSSLVVGTTLQSYVSIYPLATDNTPVDNIDSLASLVIASYDPNDIMVNPEIIYSPDLSNDPVLEYTIRFQNTGNAPAHNIRINQTMPTELDMNSYEFIASSHNVSLQYDGVMRYVFNNILLPDSATDPLGSQGFLTFRIRPLPGLAVGDSIASSAAIYFDFNPPVITNTALTVIVDPLSVPDLANNSSSIVVYPNPGTDQLNILFKEGTGYPADLKVINMFGQVVFKESIPAASTKTQLNIENLSSGIYTIVFRNEMSNQSVRFMKISR